MQLSSDAFRECGKIPLEYTKDGCNTSPPFRWADLPADTRELALIFEGVTPAAHEPWAKLTRSVPKIKKPRRSGAFPSPVLQRALDKF
jgi:hypothetical protein